MFSIEGYMDGELVFRRNTPSRRGVESLINEGLSALMAANAAPRDYIEVLEYFVDDPEPDVLSIVFVSDGYIDEEVSDLTEPAESFDESILQRDAETSSETKQLRSEFSSPLDELSDEIL
jgi:hypothetical protein